ncbi:DUF167 domain-containing protein [Candidatus Woesearchaeota archaeon]|nr:DUF167 domain-containing protein [Candidatus Woesearchaeota archaeon]
MNQNEILEKKTFRIIVKANSKENKITGIEKDAIKVNISAPADKDKANKEIIKFFSKLLKKKVRIKSGLRSKEKVLECC